MFCRSDPARSTRFSLPIRIASFSLGLDPATGGSDLCTCTSRAEPSSAWPCQHGLIAADRLFRPPSPRVQRVATCARVVVVGVCVCVCVQRQPPSQEPLASPRAQRRGPTRGPLSYTTLPCSMRAPHCPYPGLNRHTHGDSDVCFMFANVETRVMLLLFYWVFT